MKFLKIKSLVITCLICLAAIIPGILLWNALPDRIAIHFDINNNPDNFAGKGFAVFGMPLLMVALQIVCCVINDLNAYKHGERKPLETVTKWIIPIMTVILQLVTLGYALGIPFDIRFVATFIVGCILLAVGNYLPKLDYIKNHDIDTEKACKINRFIGFETVIMGVLFLVSLLFPPIASVVCIFLLIPYAIIAIIYGIVVGRK